MVPDSSKSRSIQVESMRTDNSSQGFSAITSEQGEAKLENTLTEALPAIQVVKPEEPAPQPVVEEKTETTNQSAENKMPEQKPQLLNKQSNGLSVS